MKARKIRIDFSNAKILWAPEAPEFAHFWNATSSLLPYLEPFLNRTVRACMDALPADREELRRDCKIFIAQESSHYRNHARFNELLRAGGYPELEAREQKLKADYETYWKERSQSYCLRYAEGFETTAPILSCFFLEGAREMRNPSIDDPTVDLWRWHLCEEYEHRHVCFHLHEALHKSYWLRLWGLCYASAHMLNYMIGTALYLINEDRKAGRIPDPWKSRLRFASVMLRTFAYTIPRLIRAAAPGYDPINIPPPPGYQAVLDDAEIRWGEKPDAVAATV